MAALNLILVFLIIWLTLVGGCMLLTWLLIDKRAPGKLLGVLHKIKSGFQVIAHRAIGIGWCLVDFSIAILFSVQVFLNWISRGKFFARTMDEIEKKMDDTESFYHK
jgi:hypothetical protein